MEVEPERTRSCGESCLSRGDKRPGVHLTLAKQGLGIAILPLYMAKWPDSRERLMTVLREWVAEPITVCALFSGAARLTPKVEVLLDFLGNTWERIAICACADCRRRGCLPTR